jgi:hypothetical protein
MSGIGQKWNWELGIWNWGEVYNGLKFVIVFED